ncbi:MAG: hypothetical protein KC589_07635 [Nanoarchaeota archaeon]|nr:hypothetical protein [Nanoarchaeota archaeon]
MSQFKKTCFLCGAKEDKLYEGKCEDCFLEEKPPIKEIKPINLKICNMCKKIHYNNATLTIDDLEKIFPSVVKKNLILNSGFKLNELKIKEFSIDSNKLSFEVEVDCDLSN